MKLIETELKELFFYHPPNFGTFSLLIYKVFACIYGQVLLKSTNLQKN